MIPKGTILLIPFPFTDLSGSKLRPAVVLSESQSDVLVSFITTQLQWQEPTDILLTPSSTNKIKKLSLIRLNKMATIDKNLIKGKIGNVLPIQLIEINQKLKVIFDIP